MSTRAPLARNRRHRASVQGTRGTRRPPVPSGLTSPLPRPISFLSSLPRSCSFSLYKSMEILTYWPTLQPMWEWASWPSGRPRAGSQQTPSPALCVGLRGADAEPALTQAPGGGEGTGLGPRRALAQSWRGHFLIAWPECDISPAQDLGIRSVKWGWHLHREAVVRTK